MRAHIISRASALARGASDAELQRMCRGGSLRRMTPGSFVTDAELAQLDSRERHLVLTRAVLRKSAPDAVVSHQSAAIIHGIELWNTPLQLVHMTRDCTRGGRRSNFRHTHATTLPADEITIVDGMPVTTVARTVVDLARSLSFEESVLAGDHALRCAGVTALELDTALQQAPSHPGYRRGRRVLDVIDGRSESVGESRSRALFVHDDLPAPDLQPELYTDEGDHIGRVDFLFEKEHVVGEFDGRVKYGRLVRDGEVPSDVLWAEKLREDAIRDAGWQVVRWIWSDLDRPGVVAGRIHAAIRRAQLSPPPTGHAVPTPRPGLPHPFDC